MNAKNAGLRRIEARVTAILNTHPPKPSVKRPAKRAEKMVIAEQFDLFNQPQPATPLPRYRAHIVPGDEDDPTQTLVVDGTRTEAAAGQVE